MPTTVPTALGISQQQNSIEGDTDTTFGTLDSTMVSSEMTSEVSVDYDQVKVRFPLLLPSSQIRPPTLHPVPIAISSFRNIGLRCPSSTLTKPFILDETKYSISLCSSNNRTEQELIDSCVDPPNSVHPN